MNERIFTEAQLKELASCLLRTSGMKDEDAATIAKDLVAADKGEPENAAGKGAGTPCRENGARRTMSDIISERVIAYDKTEPAQN